MKRLASAVLALSVVAAPGLVTVPAVAQTKMDCSRLYKDFWEKFDREKYAKISAEQLAGVSRMALRAYDACQAGDEQDAKALFDRLSSPQKRGSSHGISLHFLCLVQPQFRDVVRIGLKLAPFHAFDDVGEHGI